MLTGPRRPGSALIAALLLAGGMLAGWVLAAARPDVPARPVRAALPGGAVAPASAAIRGESPLTTTAAFHDATPPGLPGLMEGSLAWGDYDNDGRLDFLLTGETGPTLMTRLYHNDGGGAFHDATPPGLPGVARGDGAWADYDNDGRLDFLLTGLSAGSYVAKLYHNDGGGAFHEVAVPGLFGLDFSAVAWGDYDNDGRRDFIVIGFGFPALGSPRSAGPGSASRPLALPARPDTGSRTFLYHNDGGGAFHDATPAILPLMNDGSLAWGDYDNDGRLDLLLTSEIDSSPGIISKLYHNDGGGQFSEDTAVSLPGLDYGSVAWGDYDNDGRLDFVLTGSGGSGYTIGLYHNDGGGAFHNASPPVLQGITLGDARWGDYDGDGRLDLLAVGTHQSSFISNLYHNDGGGQFSDVTPPGLPGLQVSRVAWGDYDGDGRLDFLIGGLDSGNNGLTRLYHNDEAAANTPPGPPGNLAVSGVTASSATLSWSAATDTQTVASGLSYNLRVGSLPGAADVVGPMANTDVLTETDGLRRLPALGPARPSLSTTLGSLLPGTTYYWSVQAIDPGWAGGPFAAEGQFTTSGSPPPATDTPSPSATPPAAPSSTPVPSATGTMAPSPTSPATGTPTSAATAPPTATQAAPATATQPPPTSTRPPPTSTHPPPPTATAPPAATPCTISFADVRPADYFYGPVLYLACHGVVSGYADGTFRPYSATTRAQLVKIAVLGFAQPWTTPPGGGYTFADVPPSFPFFVYVETAAAGNLISGYACGGAGEPCDAQDRPYFRPYASVTRGQLAKITAEAAGWTLRNPLAASFADVPPGSAFYTYVETAACYGIVSGYACGGPGEPCDAQQRPYFRPAGAATRGQIAKIVYLALTGGGECP